MLVSQCWRNLWLHSAQAPTFVDAIRKAAWIITEEASLTASCCGVIGLRPGVRQCDCRRRRQQKLFDGAPLTLICAAGSEFTCVRWVVVARVALSPKSKNLVDRLILK